MPGCAACPRMYKRGCREFCERFQGELAAFEEAGDRHVHEMFMRIMYPYANRGA